MAVAARLREQVKSPSPPPFEAFLGLNDLQLYFDFDFAGRERTCGTALWRAMFSRSRRAAAARFATSSLGRCNRAA